MPLALLQSSTGKWFNFSVEVDVVIITMSLALFLVSVAVNAVAQIKAQCTVCLCEQPRLLTGNMWIVYRLTYPEHRRAIYWDRLKNHVTRCEKSGLVITSGRAAVRLPDSRDQPTRERSLGGVVDLSDKAIQDSRFSTAVKLSFDNVSSCC